MLRLLLSPPHRRHRAFVIASGVLVGLALFLSGASAPFSGRAAPALSSPAHLDVNTEATPDVVAVPPGYAPEAERSRYLTDLGVSDWHAAGFRGQGVRIAILDTGFRGYRDHLGKALPSAVTARSFRGDANLEARDSQHGILVAEVIHTLAPEAELLLANWEPEQPRQYLDAVRWARQQGARIISCSVITPSWSDGEGNGAVHAELARLLGSATGPNAMLCFACAGNIAERHWNGPFHDAGDGCHDWRPREKTNPISPWGSEQVSVEICARPGSTYQLSVTADNGDVTGQAVTVQTAERFGAVVRFLPRSERSYAVQVKALGKHPGPFRLVVLGAGLRYSTPDGSIPFPGDGPEVIAVGAVDGDGRRLSYSSCGPNSRQPKPDLVAAVPFPSSWRARPFSGTSAAAPQAAGLAALVWSHHPDWTAQQVRDFLRKTARDLGPPGHDFETGYGLIRLP